MTVKSAALSEDKKTITYTLSKGSLAVTLTDALADGSTYVTFDNFKAGEKLGGETPQSDTTLFTFDKLVTVKGIGAVKYGEGTTTGHYASADAAKSDANVKAFEERILDELVGDYTAADVNSIAEITEVKADVTADNDFKLDNSTDFSAKVAANAALTNNKKQE